MRSRSLLVAASYLSAALVSAPAFAGGESGFYLGAGVGQASFGNVDLDGSSINFDGSDTGYKAIVGYNFGIIPLFDLGVEASYVSFGKPADSGVTLDADGFGAFGLVGVNLGPVGIFGKAGAFRWDVKASTGLGSVSDTGTDPVYGAGVRFHIASFQIRAEYEYFDVAAVNNLSLLSASVLYTF